MKRTVYDAEHKDFAESFRGFLRSEVVPHFEDWERDGIMPRDILRRAGERGFLGFSIPESHGGAGVSDFRFNAVIGEEAFYNGVAAFGGAATLHNDVCLPYFQRYCTPEQRDRWFPGMASGDLLAALAMTEPNTGSDLAAISTSAVSDGDGFLLNGSKTFISSGINSDLVIVVARTGGQRHSGLTLLVVERGMSGFVRGRNLEKIGLHAADTAEMHFEDVRVPRENLLGEEGGAFRYLTSNLPAERLGVAIQAVAASRAALDHTLDYVKTRKAFGQPIGTFQNSRFVLAELNTELQIAQTFVDRCVERLAFDEVTPADAAMAKWWTTELQGRVVDRCLQLHGGYGYMLEYPIARAYLEARVSRIYAGTSEILKEVIGRSMGLG
jgi:alkylation response protein AidB-like acyl-CoA dehydrogenase